VHEQAGNGIDDVKQTHEDEQMRRQSIRKLLLLPNNDTPQEIPPGSELISAIGAEDHGANESINIDVRRNIEYVIVETNI